MPLLSYRHFAGLSFFIFAFIRLVPGSTHEEKIQVSIFSVASARQRVTRLHTDGPRARVQESRVSYLLINRSHSLTNVKFQ